jgi:hypothetical protein
MMKKGEQMRIRSCTHGLEPKVTGNGKYLSLNSVIRHAWENYYSCYLDYEPGKLVITADNEEGDYMLSKQKACVKVCVYKLRDLIPKGELDCTLEGNVLTVTF